MGVIWIGSPKYTAGHPAKVVALVAHRMVGNLRGTDSAFLNPDGREASAQFGIGHISGRLEVHQYVRLGDQAWANGNWDASGRWNNVYPTTLINARTVSVEHEDNGHLPKGDPRRGIVAEDILSASTALFAALLRGDLAELRGMGIRFRSGTEDAVCRELRAIVPTRDTIIDHHYISGDLKPYCWRPWAADAVGFPQSRYLAALTGDQVYSFPVPEDRTLAAVKDKAWLYDNSALQPSANNIQLSPARELVYVGQFSTSPDVRIVAYETAAGDTNATSKAMFVPATSISGYRVPVPPPLDCSAEVAAATAALTAQLAAETARANAAESRVANAKTALGCS